MTSSSVFISANGCPHCGETSSFRDPQLEHATYMCGYSTGYKGGDTPCRRKEAEIRCSCETNVLMISGCRCGAFQKEQGK
jgi:hypothetical protein